MPPDMIFFFSLCFNPRDFIFPSDYFMRITSGFDFLSYYVIIIFIRLSLFFLYFFKSFSCCFFDAGCFSYCCHDLFTIFAALPYFFYSCLFFCCLSICFLVGCCLFPFLLFIGPWLLILAFFIYELIYKHDTNF